MILTHWPMILPLCLVVTCFGCGSTEPAQPSAPRAESATIDQNGSDSTLNSPTDDSPQQDDDAISIINAAITALGGESNFAKANVGRTIMEIDGAFQPGITGKFTKVDTFQLPGNLNRTVKGRVQGQNINLNYIFNGDKGWMQINGGAPIDVPMANAIAQVFPMDLLNTLLSLKSEGIHLSVQPEGEFHGQPVHCIRAEADGKPVGTIYFHKTTKRIVASTKSLFDATLGESRTVETHYSDYKIAGALHIPMSIETIVDGELSTKITVTELAFLKTIDQALFAKPVVSK